MVGSEGGGKRGWWEARMVGGEDGGREGGGGKSEWWEVRMVGGEGGWG